jgi:GDP-L-fucose synthase
VLPDVVIHSAVNINSVEESLKIFFNIYNTKSLYGKLIQIGSGAEYDKRFYVPLISEAQYGSSVPVDTYGLSKYLIAKELESCFEPTKYLNLRLFGIYGPHEDYSRRFISNNIWRVMSGLGISINRDMYFDYIHVVDLTKLLMAILDNHSLVSTSYNFCSGNPILLSDLAKIIASLMGYKDKIEIKNDGLNPEYSGDPSKIFSEIGPFQFSSHEENIKNLIAHYQNSKTLELINSFRQRTNGQ